MGMEIDRILAFGTPPPRDTAGATLEARHDGARVRALRHRNRPVRHRLGGGGGYRRAAPREPGAPHARKGARAVPRALDAIATLLRGESADLSAVLLDMNAVTPFHRRVYEVARTIPAGETSSYGELATRLGAAGSARAVGQALGRNPFALLVPCHRVLAAGGRVGGFTANGGVTTKLRLLSIEDGNRSGVAVLADRPSEVGFDPAVALEHVRAADAVLARLIDTVGPFRMRLKKTTSLFAALAEAIVYQQLNGRAAATIHARVCALFAYAASGPTPQQ